jgi:hypothetical protein
VRTTYNSPQQQQRRPAHRSGPPIHSQNGTDAPATPPRPSEFLIANPRLKFVLTSRKTSPLRISNRERTPIFVIAPRPVRSNLLATSHPPLATAVLIVTPELEFAATCTKQSSNPISNCYKPSFFRYGISSAAAYLTQPPARTSIVRLPPPKILDRGAFRETNFVRRNS